MFSSFLTSSGSFLTVAAPSAVDGATAVAVVVAFALGAAGFPGVVALAPALGALAAAEIFVFIEIIKKNTQEH